MKKIIALFCAVLMIAGVCVPAFAADNTTAQAVRFNDDGLLNIMHVTDTHLSAENLDDSVWLIAKACDREQPDIVVITGDIAMADTVEETCRRIDALMNVFEERGIPTAVTFGNHDSEKGIISREDLMAYYNTFSCSISVDDGELLSGVGTYNIPVLGSDSDDVKFNLWVFDSGSYDGEGHYANVLEDQVEWYVNKSQELEAANGGKVYSLAFQHIIVPEIYDALQESRIWTAYAYPHIYDDSRYFRLDPKAENHGMLHEYPCPGYYNHGQFEAMVERGDVLAMFTGHDHTNCFSVKYKGIDIANSLSTRYNGEVFSTIYGYRMITVDENDPSSYTTRVIHWYDFFDAGDMIQGCGGDDNPALVSKVHFLGLLEKYALKFAALVVKIFTGRTVDYPY